MNFQVALVGRPIVDATRGGERQGVTVHPIFDFSSCSMMNHGLVNFSRVICPTSRAASLNYGIAVVAVTPRSDLPHILTPRSSPSKFHRNHSTMASAQAHHRAQVLVSHLTAGQAPTASATRVTEQDEATTYDGPYKYTLDPAHVLTDEQRRQYDELGFLLIKKIVSEPEIETWRQRFVDIADGKVEAISTMLVMRDVAIAKLKQKGEHAITKLQGQTSWRHGVVFQSALASSCTAQ
jgi:hypothetical protein